MATNMHLIDSMPKFVIDTCSSEDIEELIKTRISSEHNPFSRSLSLPNSGQAYKDLYGTIHYSSSNLLENSVIRSYSYPNNYLLHETSFHSQSPTAKINCAKSLLDPCNGTHSPCGSSSRYSLYGSFFDLSESKYQPSLFKRDKQSLTINGNPLLIVHNSSKLSTNTYQDKCKDWLTHLDPM